MNQGPPSGFSTMLDQRAHQPPWRLPLRLCLPGLLGAVVGGVLGFIVGGLVAAANCDWTIRKAGCVQPSVTGAIIGSSVLIPAGFLLAGRPSVPTPLLLSTLLAVGAAASGGLALAFATGQPVFIVAVPLVQLLLVTYAWCGRLNTKT